MSEDRRQTGKPEIKSDDQVKPKLTVNKVGPEVTNQVIRPEPREFKPDSVQLLEYDAVAEEPVDRLERSAVVERKRPDQVKFEKLKEKPTEEVKQEAEWGERPILFRWWFLAGGFALVTLIVCAVVFSSYLEGRAMEEVEAPDIVIKNAAPYEGSPEQWFRKKNVILKKRAIELTRSYLTADNAEDKSQYVRNPNRYLEYAPNLPIDVSARLDSVSPISWRITHTDDIGFLILNTVDKDFLPTNIYFVRDGDQLKLDWFASVAWSELSVKKVKAELVAEKGDSQLIADEGVLVRSLLRRRNEFYAGPYNDRDHAAFMIISPDKENYLWAYTERNSSLDKKLRELLDHGSFVVSLKKDVRVTVRIRKGKKDALPLQVELVELVHPNWVQPRG